MMTSNTSDLRSGRSAVVSSRRPWTRPEVTTLSARSAALGGSGADDDGVNQS